MPAIFKLDKSRIDLLTFPAANVIHENIQANNIECADITKNYPMEAMVIFCVNKPADMPEFGVFWVEVKDNSILSLNMSLVGREALLAFRKSIADLVGQSGNVSCDPRNIHRLNLHVDKEIGRDGRLKLYSWLVGREIKTTNNISQKEAAGFLRFAQPEKVGKSQYEYSYEFLAAVQAVKETTNGE